jgi:hypothetical protein
LIGLLVGKAGFLENRGGLRQQCLVDLDLDLGPIFASDLYRGELVGFGRTVSRLRIVVAVASIRAVLVASFAIVSIAGCGTGLFEERGASVAFRQRPNQHRCPVHLRLHCHSAQRQSSASS